MNRIALRLPPRLLVPLSRLLATAAVAALSACGGGGDGGSPPPPPPPPSAPTIVTQPAATTVLDAAPGSFSVVANGTAPLSFQWRRNGTDIAGATGATHNFIADFADNGAIYTVVVSNAAGSATSNGATLNVTPRAPTITTQPASADGVRRRAGHLPGRGGRRHLAHHLWLAAGRAGRLDSPTAATSAVPAATPCASSPTAADDGAIFNAVVINPAGTLESASATLTVRPARDLTPPTIIGRFPAPGAIAPNVNDGAGGLQRAGQRPGVRTAPRQRDRRDRAGPGRGQRRSSDLHPDAHRCAGHQRQLHRPRSAHHRRLGQSESGRQSGRSARCRS
jgi:hypothetical protein